MRKTICLMMVLFLLSILFTACQSEDSDLLIVPDEIKTEIETAWQQIYGVVYEWSDGKNDSYYTVRYYGTYQGATVYHQKGFFDESCKFDFSGEQFEIENSDMLEVYKDGVFYTIERACADGLLTLEDIQNIAEYHEWFELMYGDWVTEREFKEVDPISEKLLREWNEAWQKADQTSWQWNGKTGYYGTYQGAVVRMYEGAAQGTTGFNVAGEFFMWFYGFGIQVYKDGEFYSLQEAYENGLLTEKHIKSIAEQHDKCIYERVKARNEK